MLCTVVQAKQSYRRQISAGAFLAAAVWGGQLGGQLCIWGGGSSHMGRGPLATP